MSRWIVALPLIAVGVSLSDGRAASAAPIADPVAGTVTPAPRQPAPASRVPTKSAKAVHQRHRFAHQSKLPDAKTTDSKTTDSKTADSKPADSKPAERGLDALAKASLPFPPSLSIDDDSVLRPRSVPTIRFPSAVAMPSEEPAPDVFAAEASADPSSAPSLDASKAATLLSLLAARYPADKSDDTAVSPMGGAVPSSRVPLTAIELLMLFGVCGGAAIGCYGLVALAARRRSRQVGHSPASGRSQAGPPPSSRDRHADRVESQRLFPHQFGAAIRGR